MFKKMIGIMLAAVMLFAFTGCNFVGEIIETVGGVLDGDSGNGGKDALPNLPEDGDYSFYYYNPDGDEGELNGSFRIEFETDEDGNLVGKLENGDKAEESVPQKQESGKLESSKEEEPSKNNTASGKKSMISHIGLSYDDIIQLYGEGLKLNEYGALYYPNGSTPLMFYFMDYDHKHPEAFTGDETVTCVAVKGGKYPVCSYLTGNETGDEVVDKGGYYCGSEGKLCLMNGGEDLVLFDGKNTNGACLVCMHADDEGILCNFSYYWKNESDCNKKKADLIIVG